ncbi:hypothetical protein [Methylomonas albis]|uniref:Uncharacterized protein n=1 Tax=Methylomonas albis TaxID=1854563 RepID=A0ABR9CUQ4_9GAMM|nr:hypothetical protein [Methylomonas albis]MBD9354360.1 hypothetical protein [Methylomonas albis]
MNSVASNTRLNNLPNCKTQSLHRLKSPPQILAASAFVVGFGSGVYFNLPDQFSWLVECFSPLTPEPIVQATPNATNPVSLDLALQQARQTYPGGTA